MSKPYTGGERLFVSLVLAWELGGIFGNLASMAGGIPRPAMMAAGLALGLSIGFIVRAWFRMFDEG